MIKPIISTYKILRDKAFNENIDESWIKWAVEMMEAGFEAKIFYAYLFLLFSFSSSGQHKICSGGVSSKGDTAFWYQDQKKLIKKLLLPSLDTSSAEEYYRISSERQILDVWKNQNQISFASITSWTHEVENKNEPSNRIFAKTIYLTPDTARLLREFILSSKTINLPTGDSITGWESGLDGEMYFMEHSTKENYSFKV